MKILAIIPARGSSKGIPRKNIQKLAGKHLIEYTISTAKKSKLIDKIIVSTDNPLIAKISRNAGAEVPFLRPKKFSLDESPIIFTVKYTLEFLQKHQSYSPDIVLILQPTSPLRTPKMVDTSIKILQKSNATSVITVSETNDHPYDSFTLTEEYLKPFISNFEKYTRRQDYPVLYHTAGSIYTFWKTTLEKYNSFYGPRIKPLITNKLDIDINGPLDFFICEMIILHWNKHTKKLAIKRKRVKT